MKTGRDTANSRILTIQQYIGIYGTKLDVNGHKRMRPALVCPACAVKLHTVGENNPGTTDPHFSHSKPKAGTKALFCPLRPEFEKKYEGLTPTHPDVQSGIRLRNSFLQHWRQHWALIKTYVEYPDINAFINAIRHLDTSKTWEHANLHEALVPYIILSMLEFAPPNGKTAVRQPFTYRFWFDATVRTYEDLWIRTTGEFKLFKAEYHPIVPPTRTLKDVVNCYDVPLYLDFLTRPLPLDPHPFQVAAMTEAFGTV